MSVASLQKVHLNQLTQALNTPNAFPLLVSFQNASLASPQILLQYHDLLLYCKAYPMDEKMYQMVCKELLRLAKTLSDWDEEKLAKLNATGQPYTTIQCGFSRAITQWMVRQFPDDVSFYSTEIEDDAAKKILQILLPNLEYEYCLTYANSVEERLYNLSGAADERALLRWILQIFDQAPLPDAIKDELFLQLKIFTNWTLRKLPWSRSFLSLSSQTIFYHSDFIKSVDTAAILDSPLQNTSTINSALQKKIVSTMRASLAYLLRETEPVTDAQISSVRMFEVGRGVRIALVGMMPHRRLPLESYMGFMAFKNGIPVSYGGAWMWGNDAKIGVNIYEPFRKGESAWLFTQIMRVYYQQAGARNFSVEPYQFGAGNPEGLKSGAFWFYYKLGFRPEEYEIAKVAEAEWAKIKSDKSYRSSLKTLQFFTQSNLLYSTPNAQNKMPPANVLSLAVTDFINARFGGDRKKAIASGVSILKSFGNLPKAALTPGWVLLYLYLQQENNLSAKQSRTFLQMLYEKCIGDEWQFMKTLKSCNLFYK